jgi:hypothetical protein
MLSSIQSATMGHDKTHSYYNRNCPHGGSRRLWGLQLSEDPSTQTGPVRWPALHPGNELPSEVVL